MTPRIWRSVLTSIAAPAAAAEAASASPKPMGSALGFAGIIVALGAATVPRQLVLLARALEPSGDLLRDAHHAALRGGLMRIVLLDRLVPPPTVLLAALLLVISAEPVLALAEEHRKRIRAVIALGLVPLILQRLGELALTYMSGGSAHPTPGLVVTLPQQFATGPAIFWATGEAPAWVEAVSARLNLVTVWCVAIWAAGLRELDHQPFGIWHVALPAACLCGAGFITWWLGPLALSLVLGRP